MKNIHQPEYGATYRSKKGRDAVEKARNKLPSASDYPDMEINVLEKISVDTPEMFIVAIITFRKVETIIGWKWEYKSAKQLKNNTKMIRR